MLSGIPKSLIAPNVRKRDMPDPSRTNWFRNFLTSEDGPTAVEYAVILALIVVVTLSSVTFVGKKSRRNFRQVKNALK